MSSFPEDGQQPAAHNNNDDKSPLVQAEDLSRQVEDLFLTPDKETNFTWEHFFVEHCGILRVDALKSE